MTDINEQDIKDLLGVEAAISSLEDRKRVLVEKVGHGPIIESRTRHIFDRFPLVNSVGWIQYIPYFNDGDPCEWSVIGPGFNVRTWEEADAAGEEDEYEEYDEFDNWSFEYAWRDNDTEAQAEYPGWEADRARDLISALEDLGTWVTDNQIILLKAFDHAKVIVRRDGKVTSEEFSHD